MFQQIFNTIDEKYILDITNSASDNDVLRVLDKEKLEWEDFLILISNCAEKYLEPMAKKAHNISLQRFGKTIQLYAPIYLSNECVNKCKYCGFNADVDIKRKTLTIEEFKKELDFLVKKGFCNILLVAGEDKNAVNMEYLKEILKIALDECCFVALEIYALTQDEYKILRQAGANGVTLYQETYNKKIYEDIHDGPKKDFLNRLNASDYICNTKYRNIGIGALLGLSDWRIDAGFLALHAQYLMKNYWQTKVSVSVPRLREVPEGFKINYKVTDKNIVQLITAFRIFLNDAGIVLSTREPKELRDNLIPLGITQMSAGSKTSPCGYSETAELEQFAVSDNRDVFEVAQIISEKGYDPVSKDWEGTFNNAD
jgi:2-iminoacetate synthase